MRDWKWSEGEAFKKDLPSPRLRRGRQGAAVYKPPSGDIGDLESAVPWPEGNRVTGPSAFPNRDRERGDRARARTQGEHEGIGQAPRFILSCWMFKPLYL